MTFERFAEETVQLIEQAEDERRETGKYFFWYRFFVLRRLIYCCSDEMNSKIKVDRDIRINIERYSSLF